MNSVSALLAIVVVRCALVRYRIVLLVVSMNVMVRRCGDVVIVLR